MIRSNVMALAAMAPAFTAVAGSSVTPVDVLTAQADAVKGQTNLIIPKAELDYREKQFADIKNHPERHVHLPVGAERELEVYWGLIADGILTPSEYFGAQLDDFAFGINGHTDPNDPELTGKAASLLATLHVTDPGGERAKAWAKRAIMQAESLNAEIGTSLNQPSPKP